MTLSRDLRHLNALNITLHRYSALFCASQGYSEVIVTYYGGFKVTRPGSKGSLGTTGLAVPETGENSTFLIFIRLA